MKFTKLFSEEKAVSPVIGVMLMIVVTVILAAAVSSYSTSVESQEIAPQAVITASASMSDGRLILEHLSGDTLTKGRFNIEIASGDGAISGYVNMDNVTLSPDGIHLGPGDIAILDFPVETFFNGDNYGLVESDEFTLMIFEGDPFAVTLIDKNTGQTVCKTDLIMSP
ncbi:type IV pilin [Methanolobus vulcani]|uniref:Type IV pilin n=1 Tax=Methanolobus vulcani TaxID=38026 RepID=A0A7Z8KR71_9EURY|nr:type IV pilin N-terminal domain-containing protein [Methanolobus vulcani]TQD29546.1 type IV pilin [Methanolobus vulcani]